MFFYSWDVMDHLSYLLLLLVSGRLFEMFYITYFQRINYLVGTLIPLFAYKYGIHIETSYSSQIYARKKSMSMKVFKPRIARNVANQL